MGITDSPATLLLYQPLPVARRTRVQGFVDGVIYPSAIGLAGALLYLFKDVLGFGFHALSWWVLGGVAVWLAAAVALGSEYPKMIRRALKNRLLDDNDLSRLDDAAIETLSNSLRSQDSRQVLYALELLSRMEPQRVAPVLTGLLHRREQEVLLKTLAVIEQHRIAVTTGEIEGLVAGAASGVLRASALQAYCAVDDKGFAYVPRFLEERDSLLRQAAIVSSIRYGNLRQLMSVAPYVLRLESSQVRDDRLELAEIIRQSENQSLHQPVAALLEAEDTAVFVAAAGAAGALKHPRLVSALALGLGRRDRRIATMDALRAYGADLIAALDMGAVRFGELPDEAAVDLIRVLGDIDDPRSVASIRPFLANPSEYLASAAAAALQRRGYTASGAEVTVADDIVKRLAERALRVSFARVEMEGWAPALHLVRRLDDEIVLIRDRMIGALALLHRETIRRARHALRYGNDRLQALMLESLDLVLPPKRKALAMPVLDSGMDARKRSEALAAKLGGARTSKKERLVEIASQPERWPVESTRIAAVYALACMEPPTLDELRRQAESPYAGVALHARALLEREAAPDKLSAKKLRTLMLPIEKIAVLRGTDIFGDTPDHALSPLAEIAKERVVDEGDIIIHEGAMENFMCVIVDGKVEVLVGEQVVARLGAGTVVGEMQIIDPAPRSATVRAAGEVVMFQIGGEPFNQVMSDRPEIARAVNRMLVRRIRAMQVQPPGGDES
jgi:CRP/FNR family cyclic AMP-dependent transcriptional regulator